MMKVRVMKIVGVFLIFAMTTNTPVLASTARYSFLYSSTTGVYQILSLRCAFGTEAIQSTPLKIGGTKGSYDYSVIPAHAGIHSSVLIQTGIQDIIMLNLFQHLNRQKSSVEN
jgi:hypothetical protein